MKKLFYILSLLGLIVISLNTIQAQNIESDNSLLRDSKFKFPPLEVIIDSVMKHSAMINFRNKRIGVMESDLKSSKRDWTKNFGFVADTRYGTFDNFLTKSILCNFLDLLVFVVLKKGCEIFVLKLSGKQKILYSNYLHKKEPELIL